MSRNAKRNQELPGQDSFLDIVANLVGILLILIMVIGVRAKGALVQQLEQQAVAASDEAEASPQVSPMPEAASPEAASPEAAGLADADAGPVDVATPRQRAEAIEANINLITQKLNRQQFEVDYRRKERDRVQLLIATAERLIAEKRRELDGNQQAAFDLQQQLAAAQQQRDTLAQQRQTLLNQSVAPKVIDHLPTPMAKTVFGKEVHFRLEAGRVAFIPWEQIVERLKADAQNKLHQLARAEEFSSDFGPVGGFRVEYTFRRRKNVANQAELAQFRVVPIDPQLGESVAQALQPNSRFRAHVQSLPQKNTTVTIWVYPDSFDQFRTIKQDLFDRGYLTASRPLPAGHHVSASPEGSRSAAQ